VGHPSLGQPPVDLSAAFPEAAARLRAHHEAIASRALEGAIQRDATLATRHDDLGLRHLLRDAGVYVDRLAAAVGSGRTAFTAEWVDWCAPLYRRRRVPMDDLVSISEGLRGAVRAHLAPEEMAIADEAIDAAIARMRWNRRIAGDGHKRNRILAAIYKGA
jgi:hypothetical protein